MEYGVLLGLEPGIWELLKCRVKCRLACFVYGTAIKVSACQRIDSGQTWPPTLYFTADSNENDSTCPVKAEPHSVIPIARGIFIPT